VHDVVRDGILSGLYVRRRVLVSAGRAYYPGDIAEGPTFDIGRKLRCRDEVGLGLGRALDVREVLKPRGRRAVHLPRDALLVELLEDRRECDARWDGVVDYSFAGPCDQREVVGEALAHD